MMNSGYLHKIRDSAQIEDSGRIGNNTTFTIAKSKNSRPKNKMCH